MIQKIITDEWETMMHSIVHEKNEEHTHVIGESRYIYLDVEFDEEVAKGFMPLHGDHEYRLEAYIPVVVNGKPVAAFETYSDGSISDSTHAYIEKQTWDFRKIAVEKMKKENSFKVNITEEIQKARTDRDAVSDEDLNFALSEKSIECSNFKEAYRIRKEKEVAEKAERDVTEAKLKAEKDEKDAELREKRRLKRLEWAQEHGSDQLRKGLEQGYSCLKQYEKEYGIWVLGDDYVWDRDGAVEEKIRSCPSLEALEIVEELVKDERIGQGNADIQWLPDGARALVKEEDWDEDTKKGCEAISVKIKDITGLWYQPVKW